MNQKNDIFQPEADHVPDSTEAKIFEAAHRVFVQKGMDGAKMQEIADEAGINKALLHYYYRSKEKLFEMVARGIMRTAIPRLRSVLDSDLELEEKIERLVDNYVDLMRSNPFLPLFLINEMNRRPDHFKNFVLPKELPKPEKFFRQVKKAVESGQIRPVDPPHLVVNIISMCVFPILARPMMQLLLGMDDRAIKKFLDGRKAEIKSAVFASLRLE